ncbi:Sec-independent protein translocase protein TatB [Neisseria sp.]|uniref:Sec-independent protein translocase protein TatB n=1 Tax=Neisseria sp. TaxID=192066 RepID=UPI0035A1184C
MFDFGFSELLLVAAVALVVLGPERLPAAARMAGQFVGKIQRLVANVKQELNEQAELEELRKAKQEFETAAQQVKDGLNEAGKGVQQNLNDISDGLKPWERLPEMRTPADFGKDEAGNPLPGSSDADGAEPHSRIAGLPSENLSAPLPEAAADEPDPWKAYLTQAAAPQIAPTVYEEHGVFPEAGTPVFQTASLRKQAMQRKRDMRPKHRPAPKLRIRKK